MSPFIRNQRRYNLPLLYPILLELQPISFLFKIFVFHSSSQNTF